MDALMLAIALGFFLLTLGFIRLCSKLDGQQ